jgi:hypothetical protein
VQYLLQLPRLERQRYFLTQHNPGEAWRRGWLWYGGVTCLDGLCEWPGWAGRCYFLTQHNPGRFECMQLIAVTNARVENQLADPQGLGG